MVKELSFDWVAREALRRGVDQVANAVRVTLGPRGRSVVLDRKLGAPTITVDGVTIAHEIELADPHENVGARLIKEVSARTQEVAGDGTTTATVLAQALLHEGLRHLAAGASPMALKRGIDRAVARVVEEIRRQAEPVAGRQEIAQVAAVAANQDPEVGDLLAAAMEEVGKDGVITVEESAEAETRLEIVEGMQFEQGYLSPYFVTDPERMEAVLDDALLLLTDRRIDEPAELLDALKLAAAASRSLLVLAEDVDGEALSALVVNKLRGIVLAAAVRAPGSGEERFGLLEDLAVLTGGRVITARAGRRLDAITRDDMGSARRVAIDAQSTTIAGGAGRREAIATRAGALRAQMAASRSHHEREGLRVRAGRLAGGVAIIRLGAAAEAELKETRARVEDALAATRAAVEEGIVPGGGVALLRAAAVLEPLAAAATGAGGGAGEAAGIEIVGRALLEPIRRLATNAGADGSMVVEAVQAGSGWVGWNAVTRRIEDLRAGGILDPAKVVRVALQHAASIAGLLLTTEALVTEGSEGGERQKPAEGGEEPE